MPPHIQMLEENCVGSIQLILNHYLFFEIARKLIKRYFYNQDKIEDTGLTIDQVEELRTENSKT
jgi:hypothetical protein